MLIKAGDECVETAEKATAYIIPTLELQRLELTGRKANVIMHCMADHHFYQNPAWLKYAEPIAKKTHWISIFLMMKPWKTLNGLIC